MDGLAEPLGLATLRDLFERAPFGYLVTSAAGTIEVVNQTFLDWTGYAREDLVGTRRFVDLLTGGGRIYHETHWAPLLQGSGEAREIALDIVAAGGARLPALLTGTLDRDDAGNAVAVRIAVFDAEERRHYEQELVEARQAAEQSEEHARVLARTLQQTLIPHEVPVIPGLDVAAVYRPAGSGHEVGGDFHDVFQIGTDDWMLAMGDVQGKGVDAAVVTALARYAIRAAAVEHDRPSEVLRVVNDVMLRSESDRFCTAVLLRCRRSGETWSITVSCAGHPPPLLVAPGPAGVAEVGAYGSLLGIFAAPTFHDVEVVLDRGSVMVAFTDGVTEARQGREVFGEERVRRHLAGAAARPGADAHSVVGSLLDEVMAFQGGFPRDDIVIVALRVV